MNYLLRHTTRYRYSAPVTLCHNEARMLPRKTLHQECGASEVIITPPPQVQDERRDIFGNRVLYFALENVHHRLEFPDCSRPPGPAAWRSPTD